MLRITKSSEPIHVKNIVSVIYGLPGLRKTSLAETASRPLLLDPDHGSHRAINRKDVVQVDSWEDIEKISPEDVADYDTIIVDTVGRALDFMSLDIISKNPKFGYMGNLSLQGFGVMKGRFNTWKNAMLALGKDIILVVHMDEKQEGDITKERFDIQGGSRSEVYKSADAIGKIYVEGNRYKLDFSPREGSLGKNPAQFPILDVPDFLKEPQYFAGIIQKIKDHLNRLSDEQQAQVKAVEAWRRRLEMAKDAAAYNALLPDAKTASEIVKALVMQSAKERGLKFDKEGGQFYAPGPVAVPSPTLDSKATQESLECEHGWLKTIAESDGVEWNSPPEAALQSLLAKEMVTFSGKRGPSGEWYRIELTEAGRKYLLGMALQASVAAEAPKPQPEATNAPDASPARKRGRPKKQVEPQAEAAPAPASVPAAPVSLQLSGKLDVVRHQENRNPDGKLLEWQYLEVVNEDGKRLIVYNTKPDLFQAIRAELGKTVTFSAHETNTQPPKVVIDGLVFVTSFATQDCLPSTSGPLFSCDAAFTIQGG